VAVSVAYVIRSTLDVEFASALPPPNHPAVFCGGGAGGVKVNPPEKEIPLVNVNVIV
jgi:hypothetical protein